MTKNTESDLFPLHCSVEWACVNITESAPTSLTIEQCDHNWLGLCWQEAKSDMTMPIFGFAEFVAALALFAVIYTITDFRFKFRASVWSFNLPKISFWFVVVLGLGTLVSNYWFAEHWPIPLGVHSLAAWQTTMGLGFLIVMVLWAHVAGLRPPIFSKYNSTKFVREVNRIVIDGEEKEMSAVAAELGRSAHSIISLAPDEADVNRISQKPVNAYSRRDNAVVKAQTLLEIMASPNLCRAIAATANRTAIDCFNQMTEQNRYPSAGGLFAKNVVFAMLQRPDSLIFQEENIYSHGFAARAKFFMRAAFSNYKLVESFGRYGASPLDAIPGAFDEPFDDKQLKAYGRCYLMTLKSYISGGHIEEHSFVLTRAIGFIATQCAPLQFVKPHPKMHEELPYRRFYVAVQILKETLALLDRLVAADAPAIRESRLYPGIYKSTASAMFGIIEIAAAMKEDSQVAWTIQYNLVWDAFYDMSNKGQASGTIRRILNRKIVDAIASIPGNRTNFLARKILAMALNVLGVTPMKTAFNVIEERVLSRAVSSWTAKYFEGVHHADPANAGLMLPANTTYDEARHEITRDMLLGSSTLRLR